MQRCEVKHQKWYSTNDANLGLQSSHNGTLGGCRAICPRWKARSRNRALPLQSRILQRNTIGGRDRPPEKCATWMLRKSPARERQSHPGPSLCRAGVISSSKLVHFERARKAFLRAWDYRLITVLLKIIPGLWVCHPKFIHTSSSVTSALGRTE